MAEQRGPATHEVVLQRFSEICDEFKDEATSLAEVSIKLYLLLEIIFNSTVPPEFLKRMSDTLRIQRESLADKFGRELRTFWSETIHALEDQIEENEREEAALRGMREGPDCLNCGFAMQPHGTGFKCPNCSATITITPA